MPCELLRRHRLCRVRYSSINVLRYRSIRGPCLLSFIRDRSALLYSFRDLHYLGPDLREFRFCVKKSRAAILRRHGRARRFIRGVPVPLLS